ncbi:hypothetical protein Tco_0185896 [Tanacetum coccineum]
MDLTNSSREIRTEVDEEQHTNTDQADRQTADRSGRCIAQNHINTEMNERQTGRQTSRQADRQSSRFRQQIQTTDSDRAADQTADPQANADKPEQN